MESDNHLCVELTEMERLAKFHGRYFIGTGIGFSGWIMSRKFVQDFVAQYENNFQVHPDIFGGGMLQGKWSVTRLPRLAQPGVALGRGGPHRQEWKCPCQKALAALFRTAP